MCFICSESGTTRRCRIYDGDGEVFDIVRENKFLVVIKAKKGCMFTGDFQHAGVRNVARYSEEDRLLDSLNDKISAIVAKYPSHERLLRNKAMVDMMCNFPGLNRLCRLHCSTEMLGGNLSIPRNTIGFSNCWANHPDSRCHESDSAKPSVELG